MPIADPDKRRQYERDRRARIAADPDAAARQRALRRAQRARRRQRDPTYADRELDRLAGVGTPTGVAGRLRRQPKFVAIDGESTTAPNGKHEYVLLCASNGDNYRRHIQNENGLSTIDCLLFLLQVKRDNPRSSLVCFGLGYDVNMILRDVPKGVLRDLWSNRERHWYVKSIGEFLRLSWIPQKRFHVGRPGGTPDAEYQGVEVSEVFGFFQTSFLKALESWRIPDRNGALARIQSGKADRSGFEWQDIDAIREYCYSECDLLCDLMDELARVLTAAGLTPRKWQGAGSVAATMLAQQASFTANHRQDDELPAQLRGPVMRAYLGGRFELFQQGVFPDAYNYDINSAYPYQATLLPTLRGAWTPTRAYRPETPFAVWHVKWDCTKTDCPVMPFPHRYKRRISYPQRGVGYYWADEVRAAIELHGDRITVLDGWEFYPEDDERPFPFVHEYYAMRQAAKRAGLAEEKAYKLGLNSLYGKLAQSVGYRGRVPRFRSFVWAGMITSGTRATLLRMMAADPHAVIATATDGVLFTRDPAFPNVSNDLGDYDRAHVADLFVAGSGLYRDGTEKERRRGFMRAEIDWSEVLAGWYEHGPFYTFNGTGRRFIGLGTALGRRSPWRVWRTWDDIDRVLRLHPDRKFLDPQLYPDERNERRYTNVRHHPPVSYPGCSGVYVPKTDGFEKAEAGAYWVNGIEQPDFQALLGE
jgi:hypothetical protein